MFQKGDLIVYGNMGVCRVEAVEAPAELPGAGEKSCIISWTLCTKQARYIFLWTPRCLCGPF